LHRKGGGVKIDRERKTVARRVSGDRGGIGEDARGGQDDGNAGKKKLKNRKMQWAVENSERTDQEDNRATAAMTGDRSQGKS